MPGEHESTTIRVDVDEAGYRTVAVSGILDTTVVAAVCAAARAADEHDEHLVLDLIGVTEIAGDSLARLTCGLRDLGVDLDVLSAPGGDESGDIHLS